MADIADILNRAADLIEPEGAWTQNAYWRECSGWPVMSRRHAVCFCALGAIKAIVGQAPSDPDNTPAARVLASLIPGSFSVEDWNDAPERTQAEVVAKLREAAAKARGHE